MKEISFAIVMATYQRKDGTTPFYLRRALDSIFNQDYQNFKIILIGDKYEDNQEFVNIVSEYDTNKIYYENLPIAAERDKYKDTWLIWKHAGCAAYNHAISKSIEMGYSYSCHLDHDDEWEYNHLSSLKDAIDKTNAPWLCTKSHYGGHTVLPIYDSNEELIPYYPTPNSLVHSSVCIDFKKIPLRYRNTYEEIGYSDLPGDADLWERLSEYLKENQLPSYLVNKITCKHMEEGYERG